MSDDPSHLCRVEDLVKDRKYPPRKFDLIGWLVETEESSVNGNFAIGRITSRKTKGSWYNVTPLPRYNLAPLSLQLLPDNLWFQVPEESMTLQWSRSELDKLLDTQVPKVSVTMENPEEETNTRAASPPTGIPQVIRVTEPETFNQAIASLLQYIQANIKDKWANEWFMACCTELSRFENELHQMEDNLVNVKENLDIDIIRENLQAFIVVYDALRDKLLLDPGELQDSSLTLEERKVFSAALVELQKFSENMVPIIESLMYEIDAKASEQGESGPRKENEPDLHLHGADAGTESLSTPRALSTPGPHQDHLNPNDLKFSPSPIAPVPNLYPRLPSNIPYYDPQNHSQTVGQEEHQESQRDDEEIVDGFNEGLGKLRDHLQKEIINTGEESRGTMILQSSLREQTKRLVDLQEKHRDTLNQKENMEEECRRLEAQTKRIETELNEVRRGNKERQLLMEEVLKERNETEKAYQMELDRLRGSRKRASAAKQLAEEATAEEERERRESDAILKDIRAQREMRTTIRNEMIKKEMAEKAEHDLRTQKRNPWNDGEQEKGHQNTLKGSGKSLNWNFPSTSLPSNQHSADRLADSYGRQESLFSTDFGVRQDAQSLLQQLLKEVKRTANDEVFEKELFTLGCEMVGAIQQFKGLTKSCQEAQRQSSRNLQHTCQNELKKSKVTMLISEKRNIQVRFTNCHLLKPLSKLAQNLTEKLRSVFEEGVTNLEEEISKLHNLFLEKGLSEPLIKNDQLDVLMPMSTFDGDSYIPHIFMFKKRVTIYLDNSQIIQDFRGQKILALLSGGALNHVKLALGSSPGPISEETIWSILEPMYGDRHQIYRFIHNRHRQRGRIPNDTDDALYAETCEIATFHLEEIESMIVLGDATGREHSVLCTEYLNLLANKVLPSRLNLHDEEHPYAKLTSSEKFDFILSKLKSICRNTRKGQADSRNDKYFPNSLHGNFQTLKVHKESPLPTTMQVHQVPDKSAQDSNKPNTGTVEQIGQGGGSHLMPNNVIPWRQSQTQQFNQPIPLPATCNLGRRIVGIQGLKTLGQETIQADGLDYMFVEGVCDVCYERGSKEINISRHLVTVNRKSEKVYLDRDSCPDLVKAGNIENRLKLLAERSVCCICLSSYCRIKNACELFKLLSSNYRRCHGASCYNRLTLCPIHLEENRRPKEDLTVRFHRYSINCTFLNYKVQFTESMKTCATLVSKAYKEANFNNTYLYKDEADLRNDLDGQVTQEQLIGDPVYLLFNLEGAHGRAPQPVLFDSGSMLTLVFGKTLGNQIRATSLNEENVSIQGLVSNTTAVPYLGMIPLQNGSYLSVKCYSIERNIRVPGVDTKNILQFIKDNDPNGKQVEHIEVDDWSGSEKGYVEINALIGINQLNVYPKKIFEAKCGISIFEVPLRAGENCSQYCLGGSFRDLSKTSALFGIEPPTLMTIPPSLSCGRWKDGQRPNHFIGLRFVPDQNFSSMMMVQSEILKKYPNLRDGAINPVKIHFTVLAFHVEEGNIAKARAAFNEAICEVKSREKIEISPCGLGRFPEGAIFLKVGKGSFSLKQLRDTFAKRLNSKGFSIDQRFTPHITLIKSMGETETKDTIDLTGIQAQLDNIKVSELGLYHMRKPHGHDGFYRSEASLAISERPIITIQDPDQDRLDDAMNNNNENGDEHGREDRSPDPRNETETVQETVGKTETFETVTLDQEGNAVNKEGRILVPHTLLALEEQAPSINLFEEGENDQTEETEDWTLIAKDIWATFDLIKKPPFSPAFGKKKPINFKGIFSPEGVKEQEEVTKLPDPRSEGPIALPVSMDCTGEVPRAAQTEVTLTDNQLQRELHVEGDLLKSLIRLLKDSPELLPTRCPKHINCKDCRHPDWMKSAKTLRGAIENQIIESSVQVLPEQNTILCRLPLCENYTEILESSREVCVKRLKNSLKKTPPTDKEPIRESFQKLRDKGFIKAVKELSPAERRIVEESPKQAYIPTTFVWKGESITSPGRVTFDATSRTVTGKASLNECLLPGESSLTVFSIISIWRLFRFALTADISNFFCCFKLSADQWGLQRVVWIPSMEVDEEAEDFLITTLIFGFRSVTAQTSVGIRKLIEKHPELEPLLRHLYVDDLANSYQTQGEALKALAVATKILANYNLHFKDGGAISGLPPPVKMSKDGIHVSVPGHQWKTVQDTYRLVFPTIFSGRKIKGRMISVRVLQELPSETEMYEFFKETGFTLRIILSRTASIYCPGGLFSPLLAGLRGIIRESIGQARIEGTTKLDWDRPLGDEMLSGFTKTLKEVERLTHWDYPRCTLPHDKEIVRKQGLLIILADASELEGVSAYLSFPLEDGTWSMSMISLKAYLSKESHTIPKRELSSMARGASVKEEIMKHLGHLVERAILLNDSIVSLFWVLNTEGVLSVFHRNRVSMVREAFKEEDIFYVPSASNVADDLTRFNAKAESTSPTSRLFLGPDFLKDGADMAIKNGKMIPLKGLKDNWKNIKEEVNTRDLEEGFLLMPNKAVTLSALKQLKDPDCTFSQAISSASTQNTLVSTQSTLFNITERTKDHLKASSFILNPLKHSLGKSVRVTALAILFLRRTMSKVAARKDTTRWGDINNATKNLKVKDLDRYFSLHICNEMTEQSWNSSKNDIARDTVERRAMNLKCEAIREGDPSEMKTRMDELQRSIIRAELEAAKTMLDGNEEPREQMELIMKAEEGRGELLRREEKEATALTSAPTLSAGEFQIRHPHLNLNGWGSYPGMAHYREAISKVMDSCNRDKIPGLSAEELRSTFDSVTSLASWLQSLQASKKNEIQGLGNFILPDLARLLSEMDTAGLNTRILKQLEDNKQAKELAEWEGIRAKANNLATHTIQKVPLPGSLSKQAQIFKVYKDLEEMKDLVQTSLSHYVLTSQEEMKTSMGEGWVRQHGYTLGRVIFSSNRGRQATLQWTEDSTQMGLIQPYQLLFEKTQPLYLALVKYIHEVSGYRTTQRRVKALQMHHPGITATYTLVLRLAYAPGGLQIITRLIKSCLPCISRLKQRVFRQFGRLHKESLSVLYPFLCTHFDCLGPIRIRRLRGVSISTRQTEAYVTTAHIMIFVCSWSKAVHAELIEDSSAVEMSNGMTRFMCKVGMAKSFIMDKHATNLLLANEGELLVQIQTILMKRTGWSFHAVAKGNHHENGQVERRARSYREVLGSADCSRTGISFNQYQTLIDVCTCLINQVPLGTTLRNPADPCLAVVAPIDFLNSQRRGMGTLSSPIFIPKSPSEQFFAQQEHFKRMRTVFIDNVVPSLLSPQRDRASEGQTLLNEGDLVMFAENPSSFLPGWSLGKVQAIARSSEGVDREVIIKYCKDQCLDKSTMHGENSATEDERLFFMGVTNELKNVKTTFSQRTSKEIIKLLPLDDDFSQAVSELSLA